MKFNKLLILSIISMSLLSCNNNTSTTPSNSTYSSESILESTLDSSISSTSSIESSPSENTLSVIKDATIGLESKDVGKKLSNIKASASSIMYNVENIINDSGMSGSESYLHSHSNLNSRNTMFLTQANKDENYILLTLENSTSLGHLYIWNLNDSKKLDSGVKTFTISYSVNGDDFYTLDDNPNTLSQGTGNNEQKHSLINNQDYYDFKGVAAKYVKFVFNSNYGGMYYGLSEIRLYQYKHAAKENSLIVPSLYQGAKETVKIFDSSGMNDTYSIDAQCSNQKDHMFSSTRKELVVDLNGLYPIKTMALWNYNELENINYGIKDGEVYSSTDGKSYKLIKTFTATIANGKDDNKANAIVDLNNESAQFIKIVFKSNHGGDRNGLSEIRFYAGNGLVSEPLLETTGMFSRYNGWSGADGIFASNLDGNQSIGHKENLFFNFSDTFVGEVDSVTKQRKNNIMLNHTFALLKNDLLTFYTDSSTVIKAEKDTNRSQADCYYWLGDSTVINGNYYVSAHYITKEGALGFSQKGEDLVKFNIVDGNVELTSKSVIKDVNTDKLSYFSDDGKIDIIFGSAFFENTEKAGAIRPDGYIYNYGYMDNRHKGSRSLVVCRVKENNFENLQEYQYLSNEGWVNDIRQVMPLIDHVSCEMSVVQVNDKESQYYGKFVLTYQYDTTGSKICMAISDDLQSSFYQSETVYNITDKLYKTGLNYYNAKMHPSLSKENEYIITYNLNEGSGGNNFNDGDIYHPRFIKVKYI